MLQPELRHSAKYSSSCNVTVLGEKASWGSHVEAAEICNSLAVKLTLVVPGAIGLLFELNLGSHSPQATVRQASHSCPGSPNPR